jgi:hypothetical protein
MLPVASETMMSISKAAKLLPTLKNGSGAMEKVLPPSVVNQLKENFSPDEMLKLVKYSKYIQRAVRDEGNRLDQRMVADSPVSSRNSKKSA